VKVIVVWYLESQLEKHTLMHIYIDLPLSVT